MTGREKKLAVAAWNSIVCGEDCPVPWYSPSDLAACMAPYDADYAALAEPGMVREILLEREDFRALLRALVDAAKPVANRLWETGSNQPAEVMLLGERIQAAETTLQEMQ